MNRTKLAFCSSMCSLEIATGFIPLLGPAFAMVIMLTIWAVAGFRYLLVSLVLFVPFEVENIVSLGAGASQTVGNAQTQQALITAVQSNLWLLYGLQAVRVLGPVFVFVGAYMVKREIRKFLKQRLGGRIPS